jgi:hypothetical protein
LEALPEVPILTFGVPKNLKYFGKSHSLSKDELKKLKPFHGKKLRDLVLTEQVEILSVESKHVFSPSAVKKMLKELRLSSSGNDLPKIDS